MRESDKMARKMLEVRYGAEREMHQYAGGELYCTLDPNLAVFLFVNLCQLWCGIFTLNRLVAIGGVRVGEKGGAMCFYELECI
jgi:hypothetical protein